MLMNVLFPSLKQAYISLHRVTKAEWEEKRERERDAGRRMGRQKWKARRKTQSERNRAADKSIQMREG